MARGLRTRPSILAQYGYPVSMTLRNRAKWLRHRRAFCGTLSAFPSQQQPCGSWDLVQLGMPLPGPTAAVAQSVSSNRRSAARCQIVRTLRLLEPWEEILRDECLKAR